MIAYLLDSAWFLPIFGAIIGGIVGSHFDRKRHKKEQV